MDVNENNPAWNDDSGFPNGYSLVNNNQLSFNYIEFPVVDSNLNSGTVTNNNSTPIGIPSNGLFNPYLNDNNSANNFVNQKGTHLTTPGYGNTPAYQNPNQISPYQNYDYCEQTNHETSTPYSNLNNRMNSVSIQEHLFSPQMQQFTDYEQSQNQIPSPLQYLENEGYFQRQNSFNSENARIPSLPSPSPISSNNEDETSGNSEDSEGSNNSIPSKKGKKRGRKPLYKSLAEIKAARNKAQKKYANIRKATLKDLKIEVPNLEKENFELQKQKQSLLKICREMVFHPDLPEFDQSVIGAIIGFDENNN